MEQGLPFFGVHDLEWVCDLDIVPLKSWSSQCCGRTPVLWLAARHYLLSWVISKDGDSFKEQLVNPKNISQLEKSNYFLILYYWKEDDKRRLFSQEKEQFRSTNSFVALGRHGDYNYELHLNITVVKDLYDASVYSFVLQLSQLLKDVPLRYFLKRSNGIDSILLKKYLLFLGDTVSSFGEHVSKLYDTKSPLFTPTSSKFRLLDFYKRDIDLNDFSPDKMIKFFDPVCSQITEFLFLGSKLPAQDFDQLKQFKITHILNCAGSICENKFPEHFEYKTLYLLDTPKQDIACYFYPVYLWIEEARMKGGRVYVHCYQGVSRSSAMVLCFMMAKYHMNFQQALEYVKNRRKTAAPNIGFITQLLLWNKRMTEVPDIPRLFRLVPTQVILLKSGIRYFNGSCYDNSTFIGMKQVERLDCSSLDPRGVFILQSVNSIIIWIGTKSPSAYQHVAPMLVNCLQIFEFGPSSLEILNQDSEKSMFWDLIPKNAEIVAQKDYDEDYANVQ